MLTTEQLEARLATARAARRNSEVGDAYVGFTHTSNRTRELAGEVKLLEELVELSRQS
jgi:hypothetical protein